MIERTAWHSKGALIYQRNTYTTSEACLKYIQENPAKCKNIRASELARLIAAYFPDEDFALSSIKIRLSQLRKQKLVFAGKGKSSWSVNYAHAKLPEKIRVNGSPEEQDAREDLAASLEEGDKLLEDGTIVKYKPEVIEKTEDEQMEAPVEEPAEAPVEVLPEEPATEEPTVTLKTKEGEIHLTITVNINMK